MSLSPPSLAPSFTFPLTSHLLITTSRRVLTWDATGLHTIFQSRRNGIHAAREAKDGFGTIAIASQAVVVLHDTRRGQERSWGLHANDDQVRHLEYSPDSKSLFFSTSANGTIQRYSTERCRLTNPAQTHSSTPDTLAISSTGHLMLSSSSNPPVVYVKNLFHNSPPTLLNPSASSTPVTHAAFHPERPNVFLLAFSDGSIAAYDATRITKSNEVASTFQHALTDGEIAHLPKLHKAHLASNPLHKSTSPGPIIGAAFLPGFKIRAVTAGSDGRCRIIDFTNDGIILRTWHAKAPLTCLAVLALKASSSKHAHSSSQTATPRHARKSSSHVIGGPTTTNSLIAVGRVDGQIQLYDAVGLLLAHQIVSSHEEQVLSIEWIKGPSPPAIDRHGLQPTYTSALPFVSLHTMQNPHETASDETNMLSECEPSSSSHEPPPTDQPFSSEQSSPESKDEDAQTIRHTPLPKHRHKFQKRVIPGDYQDLFSPLKPLNVTSDTSSYRRRKSAGKSRPRLSPKTFINRIPTFAYASQAQHPILQHADSSDSAQASHISPPASMTPRAISQKAPMRQRHTSAVLTSGQGQTPLRTTRSTQVPNSNARVLAGLRQLSNEHSTRRRLGTLSAYAASQSRTFSNHLAPTDDQDIVCDAPTRHATRPKRVVHENAPETWPTDSVDASSLDMGDDIWLTSDSDADNTTGQQNFDDLDPEASSAHPLSWRSRRSKANELMPSTRSPHSRRSHTRRAEAFALHDDEQLTMPSHFSPDGTYEPTSEHVRSMFPRSSSMSPSTRRQQAPLPHDAQQPHRFSRRVDQPSQRPSALAAIPLNTISRRGDTRQFRNGHPTVLDSQPKPHQPHSTPSALSPKPRSSMQKIYVNTTAARPPHPLELADLAAAAASGTEEDDVPDTYPPPPFPPPSPPLPPPHRSPFPSATTGTNTYILTSHDDNMTTNLTATASASATSSLRIQSLEAEVTQLKAEVLALKAVLRRNDLPLPQCLLR